MPEPAAPASRSPVAVLFALGAYGQASLTLPMFAAPAVASSFDLADRDLALLTGALSIGSFGALALARLADRRGRRASLRLAFAGLGPLLLGSAAAPGVLVYGLAQLLAGAFHGALRSVSVVGITEVAAENARARLHSLFGLIAGLGSAVPLVLAAFLGDRPDGWRASFAVLALPVLALPWLWPRIPETHRFESAQRDGRVQAARMRDLLDPRYRRKAVGLACVGLLRGAALGALGFYTFHHAVRNVGLDSSTAALVFVAGGFFSMAGNPAGALCSERWGRRPTQVAFVALTVLGGLAYYQVPGGLGATTPLLLALCFFVHTFGIQAFGVADRLVDTELFPTALRTSYAGLRLIVEAGAAALGNFGLAACLTVFGTLDVALAVLVPTLVMPALGIFWWATTETRGLLLDQAALERQPEVS